MKIHDIKQQVLAQIKAQIPYANNYNDSELLACAFTPLSDAVYQFDDSVALAAKIQDLNFVIEA